MGGRGEHSRVDGGAARRRLPHTLEALISLVEQSGSLLGVVGADGHLIPGPVGFLGHSADEVAEMSAFELIHPDDAEEAVFRLRRAFVEGSHPDGFQCRLRTKSGEWRWYEIVGTNMFDDPDIGGLVFNGRDIHDQKLAEEEIARQERRWRALQRSATERVTVVNAEGRIIFSTSDGTNLGYEAWGPEDMATRVLSIIPPEDIADGLERFAGVLETPGPSPSWLIRIQDATGRWMWTEVLPNNQLDNPDVGGIIMTTRDVTEREDAMVRLQEEAKVLETLHVVGRRLAGELDLETLLQEVTDAGRAVTDAAFGCFFHPSLTDEGDAVTTFAVSGAPREVVADFPERAPGLFGRTFEGGAVIRIEDVPAHRMFAGSGPNPLGIRSYLAVPVLSRRGEPLGGLFFGHPEPGVFTERHERLAVGIGDQAAIAIDNARLYQAAQREIEARREAEARREEAMVRLEEQTHVLEILRDIGERLAGELDLEVLLQEVTDAATDVTDAAFGAFFYNDVGDDGEQYLLYTLSGAPRAAFADFPMPRATGLFGPTFEGKGPVRIGDVRTDPRYGKNPPYEGMPPGHLDVRSYLAVPVVSRSGEVHGGLFFGHPDVGVFTERGERLAAGIAAQAAIAIDSARLYQAAQREIDARREAEAELAHQATHDPLTGLPNRVLLQDRLGQALAHISRDGHAVAVLLLDLDRFKVVNDSLGHAAGDRILKNVADRLWHALRPGDTVARLGGDEFVLVCDGVNGELDAVGVADRVRAAFAAPFAAGGERLQVSASIGIAIATDESSDAETLLRDADAVMYRAKERGGNRWEIFDASLRDRVVERLRIETDLRSALDADEVSLYLQPVVALATGRTVGAEGLARWHRPDGVVLPSGFIRVAEESGLIVPLGERMLVDGCRRLAAWAKDGATAEWALSVNASARQLVQADLVGAVRRAVDVTGADPRRLSLEITETALMEDVEAIGTVLRRLRALGVQLWVDDFGTGYSSLIYLRRFPLDGLKIDRSFVAGLEVQAEDDVIIASIINLAHSLGLSVLAEGVETQQQADGLRELGCDLAQGHLWSPAVPELPTV